MSTSTPNTTEARHQERAASTVAVRDGSGAISTEPARPTAWT